MRHPHTAAARPLVAQHHLEEIRGQPGLGQLRAEHRRVRVHAGVEPGNEPRRVDVVRAQQCGEQRAEDLPHGRQRVDVVHHGLHEAGRHVRDDAARIDVAVAQRGDGPGLQDVKRSAVPGPLDILWTARSLLDFPGDACERQNRVLPEHRPPRDRRRDLRQHPAVVHDIPVRPLDAAHHPRTQSRRSLHDDTRLSADRVRSEGHAAGNGRRHPLYHDRHAILHQPAAAQVAIRPARKHRSPAVAQCGEQRCLALDIQARLELPGMRRGRPILTARRRPDRDPAAEPAIRAENVAANARGHGRAPDGRGQSLALLPRGIVVVAVHVECRDEVPQRPGRDHEARRHIESPASQAVQPRSFPAADARVACRPAAEINDVAGHGSPRSGTGRGPAGRISVPR